MSDFRWTWLDRVEGEDSPLPEGARHLANVLVRHYVRKGEDVCWPGVRRVGRQMGVGAMTAHWRFQLLEHFGYLRTTHRGSGKSDLRVLVIPDSEFVPTVMPLRPRGGKSVMPGETVSERMRRIRERKSVMPSDTHRTQGHYRTTNPRTTSSTSGSDSGAPERDDLHADCIAELLTLAFGSGELRPADLEELAA